MCTFTCKKLWQKIGVNTVLKFHQQMFSKKARILKIILDHCMNNKMPKRAILSRFWRVGGWVGENQS